MVTGTYLKPHQEDIVHGKKYCSGVEILYYLCTDQLDTNQALVGTETKLNRNTFHNFVKKFVHRVKTAPVASTVM